MMFIPSPFWAGAVTGGDPHISSVGLLVQDGVDTVLEILNRVPPNDSVTAVANAEWDSAQQVLGANMITSSVIGPNIPSFTSSGVGSRFTRAAGEAMTVECYIRYASLGNFVIAANLWYWSRDTEAERTAHLYLGSSAGTLTLRLSAVEYTFGNLSANRTYFVQLTVTGDTYYIDVDGVQVGTGTFPSNDQTGTYRVYVASNNVADTSGAGNSYWVTPLRWTKGVARARGSVPTALFPTF